MYIRAHNGNGFPTKNENERFLLKVVTPCFIMKATHLYGCLMMVRFLNEDFTCTLLVRPNKVPCKQLLPELVLYQDLPIRVSTVHCVIEGLTYCTVPTESIYTPGLFPHFVVLQPEFIVD
jgi:hypothetical protein